MLHSAFCFILRAILPTADLGHFVPRCGAVKQLNAIVRHTGVIAVADFEIVDRHRESRIFRPPLALGDRVHQLVQNREFGCLWVPKTISGLSGNRIG
jgi:hypothetical protein